MDTTIRLYASNAPTTIVNKYGSLKTRFNILDTDTFLELETTADNTVYMGNSSVCALPSGIRSINNATWTFHYFGVANDTDASFFVNGTIVDASEVLVETLFTEEAETGIIQTANDTYTATVTVMAFDINQTALEECGPYYLKIDWLINSAGANLTVDLLLDTDNLGNFTYISGINLSYGVPDYLGTLIGLIGFISIIAIVIFTVKSSFPKGD